MRRIKLKAIDKPPGSSYIVRCHAALAPPTRDVCPLGARCVPEHGSPAKKLLEGG